MRPSVPFKPHYAIGINNGTSCDAVDAVLVRFAPCTAPEAVHFCSAPITTTLRNTLQRLMFTNTTLDDFLRANHALAALQVTLCQQLLAETRLPVAYIASHGQTVRHQPQATNSLPPHTWQLSNPAALYAATNIPVIDQFRIADVAAGGQGAPLTPFFHQAIAHSCGYQRACFINIGGIINLTGINGEWLCGYDVGPGNSLLDLWYQQHHPNASHAYDANGEWARTGTPHTSLVNALLHHPYFDQHRFQPTCALSSHRDAFSLQWLHQTIASASASSLPPEDIQASLLTMVVSLLHKATCGLSNVFASSTHNVQPLDVFLCGGGSLNTYLLQQLDITYKPYGHRLHTTNTLNYAPQHIESLAFAWLGLQRVLENPLPFYRVTSAQQLPLLHGALTGPMPTIF